MAYGLKASSCDPLSEMQLSFGKKLLFQNCKTSYDFIDMELRIWESPISERPSPNNFKGVKRDPKRSMHAGA